MKANNVHTEVHREVRRERHLELINYFLGKNNRTKGYSDAEAGKDEETEIRILKSYVRTLIFKAEHRYVNDASVYEWAINSFENLGNIAKAEKMTLKLKLVKDDLSRIKELKEMFNNNSIFELTAFETYSAGFNEYRKKN